MKDFFEKVLAFLVQILMWIGIPLGFIVWQIRKLFVKDSSGWEGLAAGLATLAICGLITVVGVIILLFLL